MKSFTLVETLISIFVFGLALGAIFSSALFLYKTHGFEMEQSLAISEARRGIEIMVKEIRKAREGENGAYPIEYAGDKELIFYSDIDGDGKTERVRYFLGEVLNQVFSQKCVTFSAGGSCSVSFSNFLRGELKSAKVSVFVEGDLGSQNEYVDIFVDGQYLGRLCQRECTDCAGNWQGLQVFDVLSLAKDGVLNFTAQASSKVNSGTGEPVCNWEEPGHKMKARFDLEISQEIQGSQLKKGVIKAVGSPPTYPLEQEKISIISQYVRNLPPIFEYFDQNGKKIEDYPARLAETKLMKVFLVVDVNPERPPKEYQLESYAQLRNLKSE